MIGPGAVLLSGIMRNAREQSVDVGEQINRSILNLFIFPLSPYGLFHIAAPVVCMLILYGLTAFLVHFYGPIIFYVALIWIWRIFSFFIWVDFFYYLIHCIRESAQGAVRAPDSLFAMESPFDTAGSLVEVVLEYLHDAFPILLCFLPPFFYFLFTLRVDWIFWLLLGAGAFYFPMQFLAVVMFGSSTAYNPFVIVGSIFRTLFSYMILVIQFFLICAVFVGLVWLFSRFQLTAILFLLIQLYFMIVIAHLLGRFYFIKQDKLDWEV